MNASRGTHTLELPLGVFEAGRELRDQVGGRALLSTQLQDHFVARSHRGCATLMRSKRLLHHVSRSP